MYVQSFTDTIHVIKCCKRERGGRSIGRMWEGEERGGERGAEGGKERGRKGGGGGERERDHIPPRKSP